MPTGGCLKIQYTGAQASCLLEANATAKTLTSKIGAAGSEAVDSAFGVVGVLDLTLSTNDTLNELCAIIDAYTNYSCTVLYGDDITAANILTATVQAKSVYAYILFDSVLNTYALTNYARVEALMGTERIKSTDQVTVEYILNAITEQAELLSCRKFKARSYGVGLQRPYDFDGSGRDCMVMPAFPINSVSHVYLDGDRAFGSTTEIAATDYIFYEDEGIIAYPNSVFTKGRKNVRVEYNAGYATIPSNLQQAAVECVDWNITRFRSSSIGRKGSSADGVNTSLEIDIPLSARRVFESYKDARL